MRMQSVILLFTIVWPAYGLRVVSTSPQTTEFLFQLGMGSQIVGTSQFSNFPVDAKRIPEIGPLFNPGVEKTLRLKPDLVLGDRETENPFFLNAMDAFGVKHLTLNVSTATQIFDSAEKLLVGSENLAIKQKLNLIARCLNETKVQNRKPFSFLVFAWLDPAVIFSDQTLLSDLIAALGGANAFAGRHVKFPQVSHEWLMKQSLDRIYILSDAAAGNDLARWHKKIWPIRETKVITVDSSVFARSNLAPMGDLAALALPGDSPLPAICRNVHAL